MLLALAAALELDDVAVSTLEKTLDAEKQSSMGSAEKRRANIAGAYKAADPELVEGKRILLIDDIVTTGSTLSECAKTLLSAGAAEVLCAAVARTRDD
jgi:predicted amidophosphoribosyltransferase